MTKVQFARQYEHSVGNGTRELYVAGDIGTFDEGLANSLVYEGFAAFASEPEQVHPAEARETKVTGPEETKPENKKKK